MNIEVHVFFHIMFFSGYMPRSGIAGLITHKTLNQKETGTAPTLSGGKKPLERADTQALMCPERRAEAEPVGGDHRDIGCFL